MAERKIETKLQFDGEKEYKEACKGINNSLKVLGSEMKVVTAQYGANDKSIEGLTAKQNVLKKQYDEQVKKVQENEKALAALKAEENQNADAIARFEVALNNSKAALANTEKSLKDTADGLDKAEKEADQFGKGVKAAGDEAEQSGGKLSKLGGVIGDVAKGFSVGMAAIGTAVVAGLGYAVSVADDVKGAMNDFEAATGIAEAGAKGFEDSLKNIYNGNYGEDFDDIAASMATVAQSAKDTDPANIEKLTTSALALRDTFEYDIQEQMRAVNMLMDQFGISGEEAFNLIAQGSQNGLNKNGDLLDSINEYSVHFKSLGLDAEEMFNSFANGAESGTFSVDKLGDAFKEFGIRVKDESKGTTEALTTLGLDAGTTAKAFAAGGEQAKAALSEVTNKIFAMEDPLAQNQAGVALFGTMWEDLGVEGMKALTNINGEISTATDAMAKINEVKYDTVGEAFTGLGRIMKTSFILPLGEELTPLLSEFANTMTSAAQSSSGDITTMADAFGKGISDMINGLSEKLPEFEALATKIIMGLADGLVNNLPTIVMAAANITISLVQGLIDMLPKVVDGAMQIITQLGIGIAQALPTLIPKLVETVVFIVQTLVDNIPLLIDAALQLILGLAQGIVAAIPQLVAAIPQIIISLVDALIGSIPQIIEAGIQLLVSLVSALPEIITAVVAAIPQIIDGVITAVIEAIPLIIQAGIDLLISLIQALPEIITTIVAAIPQIIGGLVDAVIGNIDKIILAGVQLFVSLIENLPTIIVEIVKAIPQIITGIVEAIGSLAYKLVEAGGNLISGLWEGISNAGAWLWEKVSGFFGGIVDGIKGFLGIHSPSTVFADIGDNMAAGVGVGFDDGMGGVSGDMESSLAATSSASAKAAIDALSTGLTSNISLLAPAITAIVAKIGDGLTADAAKFINQGTEIVKRIAEGIVKGIPQLVAAIPQVVTSILNAFNADNAKFVNQGTEIDKKIAAGMVSGIPYLVTEVPKLVTAIENAFSGYMSRFATIGENIMRGIGSGITAMSGWLDRLINNYIDSMIASVENKLEINSPSKVFAGIGGFMAQGLGDGFVKEMQAVEKGIRKAIPTEFDTTTARSGSRGLKRSEDSKPTVQVTQHIYTPQYDYVAQQREAAKQFKLIARMV